MIRPSHRLMCNNKIREPGLLSATSDKQVSRRVCTALGEWFTKRRAGSTANKKSVNFHSKSPSICFVSLYLLFLVTFSGCLQPIQRRAALPDSHEFTREQLLFHSDVPLPAHHRLFTELIAKRVDLSQELMLPVSDEPIHIYVFEDALRFDTFLRLYSPDSPRRRAFFRESDTRLEVYTQWGDRVAEDLRHETTHAYLHAVIPNIPLWLDEGLAEYYEMPRGCHGVNQPHVDLLIEKLEKGEWRPDLPRLEAMEPTTAMSRLDYAEAWAWVHLMLNGHPPRAELIRETLRELHRTGQTRPLWDRISTGVNDPRGELIAHLKRLANVDH